MSSATMPGRQILSLSPWILAPILALSLAGLADGAFAHHGNAAKRYVAVNGKDIGDCSAPAVPCATIGYAIDRAGKGDQILVAAGTYRFAAEEAASLQNPVVTVSGGYNVKDGFSRQDLASNPTYVLGPNFSHRTALAELGFILVQDAKALTLAQSEPEPVQFVPPPPGLTARYVDDDGVDDGECLSSTVPCASIGYARSRAAAGDQIVVAGGTYAIDPDATALLLDDTIPIRGGYSRAEEFLARDPASEPTYLMGPPFQQRARLAARGFTLLQDPKAETIETMIARSQVAPIAAPAAPAICTGGMAGPYPCLAVDFLSQIPLNEFSSNPSAANDIWGFVDLNDDREYAIIGLRNGTAVVDVSDPQNPTEVGTIPGLASIWRDIKVLQTFDAIQSEWQAYAYVTVDAAAQGLQIIDLTDLPASISLAGTYHGIASAHNIYIANIDYASGAALPGLEPFIYILGSDRDNGAFRILDVSDPIVPVEVTAPPQGTGYVHDAASLVISDARVSACRPGHRPCELLIDYNETTVDLWDVTDKTEPFLISSTPYAGAAYTHSGWATGDGTHVFIQDELDEQNQGVNTTLRTLDIADLSTPFVSNVWIGTTTSIDHNGFVKDQRYYMSNYRRGLTILDINNPNDPQEVAFFDTFPNPADNSARFEGAWGTYPFLPSGTLLVSDIQSGLFVLREQLVPPPAVTASLGYAWADQPAAAIYEPSPTYAFNSAGGPITVNRQGTGRYSVRFAGLGGQGTVGGNVEVTPYGTDLVRCKVDGWNSGSADFIANVVCFDPAGTAADARYTVLVRWPDRG